MFIHGETKDRTSFEDRDGRRCGTEWRRVMSGLSSW